MARAVILEHTRPDRDPHLDWMIEDPRLREERRLLTWRVTRRPDRVERFEGERIGMHRAAYLDHQGEVSGGRGRVIRLARGDVIELEPGPESCSAVIVWEPGRIVRYEGRILGSSRWVFRASEPGREG